MGDKLLVKPFLIQTSIHSLESDSVRINPVYFRHGYTFLDTISIILPDGMSILEPLAEIDESNQYGQITMHSLWDATERKIEIVRAILLNSGVSHRTVC